MANTKAAWYYIPDDDDDRFFHDICLDNSGYAYLAYTIDHNNGGGGKYLLIVKVSTSTLAVSAAMKITPASGYCSVQGLTTDGTYLYCTGFFVGDVGFIKLNCSDLAMVEDKYIPNTFSCQSICLGTDYNAAACIFSTGFPSGAGDLHIFKLTTALGGDANKYMFVNTTLGMGEATLRSDTDNSLYLCGVRTFSSYYAGYIYRVNQASASGGVATLEGKSALTYYTTGSYASTNVLACMLFDIAIDSNYVWAAGWVPKFPVTSLGVDTMLMRALKADASSGDRLKFDKAWRIAHSSDYSMRGMGLHVDADNVYIGTGILPHSGLGTSEYMLDGGFSAMRLNKDTLINSPGLSKTWTRGFVRYDHGSSTFYALDNHDQSACFRMTQDSDYLYCAGWTEIEVERKSYRIEGEDHGLDTDKTPMLWKIPRADGGTAGKYDDHRGKFKVYDNSSDITITDISSASYFSTVVEDQALNISSNNATDITLTYSAYPTGTTSGTLISQALEYKDPTHHVLIAITSAGTFDDVNNGSFADIDDPIGSPDDATTQIYTGLGDGTYHYITAKHEYSTKTTSDCPAGTVREIRVYARGYSNYSTAYTWAPAFAGSGWSAPVCIQTFNNAAYKMAMQDFTTNSAWAGNTPTWADVIASEPGAMVRRSYINLSWRYGYVTQAFMEVNFDPVDEVTGGANLMPFLDSYFRKLRVNT